MTSLAPTLQTFFTERLINQRDASPHTIKSYRDTFHLLLLFAKVKLETGAPQARVLVSDQSIGTDQGRRYVLVVGKGDKTEYRPVELGPVVDGLRVIEHGLQPGERIVVKGLVRPGMQVTPQAAAIDGTPKLAVPMSRAKP